MSATRVQQLTRLARELMVARSAPPDDQRAAQMRNRIEHLNGAATPPPPAVGARRIDVYG